MALQNAGGIGTYVPPLMLAGLALYLWRLHEPDDAFDVVQYAPVLELGHSEFLAADCVRVWGAGTPALVVDEQKKCAGPHKTFPRAIFGSAVSITGLAI